MGKSTLLKTILGFLPPISGEIKLFDQPLGQYSPRELAKKIAVVLTERPPGGNLTVEQLVALGRIPHTGWLGNLTEKDRHKVQSALRLTNIEQLKTRRIGELSDGQLQIAMVARALAQDGELLILDEPTAHLDLINRWEIMQLLRRMAQISGKAVLMVTHDLEQALDSCDQLWVMPSGRGMLGGIPEDMLLQGKLDLLIPDSKLYLDKESGKICATKQVRFPEITGSPSLKRWVKNFLRKTPQLPIRSLHVEDDPFSIQIKLEDNTHTFRSFEQLHQFILRIRQ